MPKQHDMTRETIILVKYKAGLRVWCACVLHSIERHYLCTAQYRETLCVYCTVQRGTVCVLHSVERHCVCNAQYIEALCVYCTV